jgi:hypothetical protein
LDGRFEAYQKPLFSRGASETNRELQDKAFNDKLNGVLEGFLRLVSGHFATAAAAKCLEYLIRRFKIHVYNVEAAVTCALPYHATAEFVKLVQLANLEGTSFYWLEGVKEKGAAPPRDGPRRAMRARRRVPELRVRSRSRQRQRKGECAFFGFRFGRAARVEEAASSRAWFLFFSRRRRRSSTRRVPKGPPPFLPSDAAALVR